MRSKIFKIITLITIFCLSSCALLPKEENEIAVPEYTVSAPEYKMYTVKKSGVDATFTGIGTVVSLKGNYAIIEVPSASYGDVYSGMTVSCSFNNKSYNGVIIYSSAEKEKTPESAGLNENFVGVGIRLIGAPRHMLINDTVSVYALISSKSGVITVPTSAVYEYNGESYVYVWSGNVREERRVELGIRSDSFYEVVSGLSEGEQITLR